MKFLIIFTLFVLVTEGNDLDGVDYVTTELIKMKIKQNGMERKMQQLEDELDQYKFEICGKDWISYSNTKCFRVLERKGSANETKRNCSELDESSTLITIGSLNEQKFIEKLVQKYNTLSDRVWIGLEWNDNTFKWMDGSDVSYENWDENGVKNGINKCVQISISNLDLGKWTDDVCTRKYLMACQKKQASKNNMQKDLSNLTRIIGSHQSRLESLEAGKLKLDQDIISENKFIESHGSRLDSLDSDRNSMKADISSLKDSSMPIGFLYIEIPNQSSPEQLWPSLQWTDVTQQYAGLFFRSEGGDSSSFGDIQEDNTRRLKFVETSRYYSTGSKETKVGSWADMYRVDDVSSKVDLSNAPDIRFYISGGEIRPRNMAMRIWKRIG